MVASSLQRSKHIQLLPAVSAAALSHSLIALHGLVARVLALEVKVKGRLSRKLRLFGLLEATEF